MDPIAQIPENCRPIMDDQNDRNACRHIEVIKHHPGIFAEEVGLIKYNENGVSISERIGANYSVRQ